MKSRRLVCLCLGKITSQGYDSLQQAIPFAVWSNTDMLETSINP